MNVCSAFMLAGSGHKYALSTEFGDLFNGKDENNNEIIFRFANVAKTGVAVYEDYWYQSYRIKRAGYCAFIHAATPIQNFFRFIFASSFRSCFACVNSYHYIYVVDLVYIIK